MLTAFVRIQWSLFKQPRSIPSPISKVPFKCNYLSNKERQCKGICVENDYCQTNGNSKSGVDRWSMGKEGGVVVKLRTEKGNYFKHFSCTVLLFSWQISLRSQHLSDSSNEYFAVQTKLKKSSIEQLCLSLAKDKSQSYTAFLLR